MIFIVVVPRETSYMYRILYTILCLSNAAVSFYNTVLQISGAVEIQWHSGVSWSFLTVTFFLI